MSTSGASKEYERCVVEGYFQLLIKRSQSTKKGVLTLYEGTYFCTKNLYSRLKMTFYTRKKGNPSHHVAGSKFVLKTYLTVKSNVCKSLSNEELPYII